jgi:tetratricopeptide (TPR) repeat protein
MRRWILSLVVVGVLGLAWGAGAQPPADEPTAPATTAEQQTTGEEPRSGASLPSGLATFLEARLLESSGLYSDALSAYAKALEEDPARSEVRIRYAALLLEMGLAGTAVEVLEEAEELDWFGERTLGLALAQLAGHRGDMLERAEKSLRNALDMRPDEPNLQLSLAQVYHRQGKLAEAAALVAELRSSRDGNPRLMSYHAGLLRSLGRIDEAVEAYTRCARAAVVVPECRNNLIELLIELGRPVEAAEAMLQWLGDDDLDRLVQAASLLSTGGEAEEALLVIRRVLAAEPDSARARTIEAYLLSTLDRHEEAAAALRKLLRKDPSNLDLMVSLAWNEMRLGRLDEARELLDGAWEQVVEEPASERAVELCLSAARIELEAGDSDLARQWLGRVGDVAAAGVDLVRLYAASYREAELWREGMAGMLRLQPQVEGQARNEAIAYEAEFRILQGETDQGLIRLRRLLDSERLDEVLLAVQVLQATERWFDVERATESALERLPDDRNLLFARAAALERMGQPEQASGLFEQILETDPHDAGTANYLGYMWADQGVRLDDALELIQRAVELDPDNVAYIDSLGWVHYRLGNLEEAHIWLERAVQSSEPDGTIFSHFGEILVALGEEEKGRRYLLRALELGCDDPEHVQGILDRLGE